MRCNENVTCSSPPALYWLSSWTWAGAAVGGLWWRLCPSVLCSHWRNERWCFLPCAESAEAGSSLYHQDWSSDLHMRKTKEEEWQKLRDPITNFDSKQKNVLCLIWTRTYILYVLIKYLFYILKRNLFLWCKAEFSASLLQSSVSHDPSEIILICCSRNIYYQCWKQSVLLHISAETMIHLFQDSLMNKEFK